MTIGIALIGCGKIAQGRLELPQPPYYESVKASVRHFLESIVHQTEPLTSGRDNLKTMAVIDAIYQAAETRTVVEVLID